jgi:AraC-like DNA-binding protein
VASANPYPTIGDYALIGDCHTAALIARDSSVDWFCPGRFDAPAVFCRLLDAQRGGYLRSAPTEAFSVERRYHGQTNVLESVFSTDTGRVRATDLMPVYRRTAHRRGYDVDSRYVKASSPDPLVDWLLVELRRPDVAIEHVADHLDVSPRSLHRRSTAALGYGPKTLQRILRLRRALRLVHGHIRLAEAAYRAGYADQAHLTNEFQRFLGATPRALMRSPIVLAADGV